MVTEKKKEEKGLGVLQVQETNALSIWLSSLQEWIQEGKKGNGGHLE